VLQSAEEARGALSAEQSKTLKLEAQMAELTEKLNSVQVRPGHMPPLGCSFKHSHQPARIDNHATTLQCSSGRYLVC
jgi:hypothetical protein